MADSILKVKSYQFAILIVKQCQILASDKKEYVLSKQLLRSGTAIGALIREAEFAQSRKDFINKLSIALKETNESLYWIDLLRDTDYIDENQYNLYYNLNKELIAILVSSIKTSKSKL